MNRRAAPVAGFVSTALTALLLSCAAALVIHRILMKDSVCPTVPAVSDELFSSPDDQPTRQHVTVFHTVEHHNFIVVTGHEYQSAKQPYPDRQFCYATTRSTSGNGLIPSVYFAVTEGQDGRIRYIDQYESALIELAMQTQAATESMLRAKHSCHWLSPP